MKLKHNKICHITTVHPAFDVRIFHKECKTLVNAGYNVTLIAQHDKNEIVDGINIVALPMTKNRLYRMLCLPFKAFVLALEHKVDIYHLHDPEFLAGGILLKLFAGKKFRVIYDVHEDYAKQTLSKSYIPKVARRNVAFMIKLTERVSVRLFDGIVAATDDILNNFSYHKKAVGVRNFPIVSKFPVSKSENKDGRFSKIIYVGGLAETRGVTKIVKALELINPNKKLELMLCGKFVPPNYEKKLKKLGGFRKVKYLGWIEPKKVPELLNKADAGIVCFLPEPNHIKAMPNKIFEYMSVGLPVIASNFPLWKEIVEDNNCGVCVDPLKPKEIAGAIEYLSEHPAEAKIMGENGRRAVLEKYNWENESKKLLKVYEEFIKR